MRTVVFFDTSGIFFGVGELIEPFQRSIKGVHIFLTTAATVDMEPSPTLKLELSSHPGSIRTVEAFVAELAERFDIERQKYGDILTSLTEAVNNAINHGNCNDARKKVKINLIPSDCELTFRVSDEGCGFDYKQIPDPTVEENVCQCGGRGVFLMCHLTDRIAFINGGRTVEMAFRL